LTEPPNARHQPRPKAVGCMPKLARSKLRVARSAVLSEKGGGP